MEEEMYTNQGRGFIYMFVISAILWTAIILLIK